MSRLKPLYELPLPSTEIEYSYLCDEVFRFQYIRDGAWYRSGIRFDRVAATRTRAERCSKLLTEIDGGYDTLVEVLDSPWREEVRADMNPSWRDRWQTNHYAIYVDSYGSFELIAASWEILPEEPGQWPET